MRKWWGMFILSMSILGTGFLMTGCSGKETKAAEIIEEALAIEETEESKIDVFGSVEANVAREIYVDFPAFVEEIYVKAGDQVQKGEPLVKLNVEEYKNEILRKEQEIQLLEIELLAVNGNLSPESAQIAQKTSELNLKKNLLTKGTDPEIKVIQEQIALVDQKLKVVSKEYEVSKQIGEAGGIAGYELEKMELNIHQLKGSKKEYEAQLEKLKNDKQLEIDSLSSSVKGLQTTVNNTNTTNVTNAQRLNMKIQIAQTELKALKNKLDRSYLKENMIVADQEESIISEVLTKEGSLLSDTVKVPLLRMMDTKDLVITVDVPESFINHIALGNKAKVTLLANKDQVIEAKVSRIANQAVTVNGENMIKVDIEPEGNKELLKQGYEVDACIFY